MNKEKEELKAFTVLGYNNKAKPCPEKRCKGWVWPTVNANVGRCDTCHKRIAWLRLVR
mgnify:CR=1 FL=1